MENLKLLLGFNILLSFCVIYSASLQYVPPSRELDIVQSGSYRIGAEEDGDTSIYRCHFTSNTGLNHSFDVLAIRELMPKENFSDEGLYLFENKITDHGREGLCQITVANVQDTGPSVWSLVIEEFDQNLTAIEYKIHFFYKAPLVNYEIRIMEFTSFMNHMQLSPEINLQSCILTFNGTTVELDMHSPKVNIFLSPYSMTNEQIAERLSGLGRGLCGFKYINATRDIRALEWVLTGHDVNGKSHRGSFVTRINERTMEGNLHSRRSVYMGSTVDISCGSPLVQPFCSLFNPAGELVYTANCKYKITSFGMDHIGVWKCYSGTMDNMESTEYTIELIGKGAETVGTWQNETEDYVNIGCQMVNFRTASLLYCKMIAPDQRLFNVKSFTATDRYLSIGTDFNKAVCSMQIKKPLKEFEKGLWRCEIGISYRNVTGGFLRIGKDESVDYPKHIQITTQLHEPFTIFCAVPYFTEYCNIRAPNGIKYFSQSESEVRLGRCSIEVTNATIAHNGTWVCSFARETGVPDDEITVEVIVAQALSYYKLVEVDVGDTTELMCSTGGLPLKYCRFISPTGRGYHIHNHGGNSSVISYHGRGLEYGECGIRIPKIQSVDNGYWTCIAQLVKDDKPNELSAQIMVDVAPTLMDGVNVAAIGIGTAVGITLVSTVFGVLGVRRWRRRRHREVAGFSTAPQERDNIDNLSRNSELEIFAAGPPLRSYTNPQPELRNEEYHEHQL